MTNYVTEVKPADVLFGRGSGPNDHEGNVQFRQYVAERKAAYTATNHRMTKTKIAQEILDLVFQRNGRFLKKIEDKEIIDELKIPEGIDCYEVVKDDTVMEKAKQALRQNAGKYKEEVKVKIEDLPPMTALQQQTSLGAPGLVTSGILPSRISSSCESIEPYPYRSDSYGDQQQAIAQPITSMVNPQLQPLVQMQHLQQQQQQQQQVAFQQQALQQQQQQRLASGSLYMSSVESMPPPVLQTTSMQTSDFSVPELPGSSMAARNRSGRGSMRASLTIDQVFDPKLLERPADREGRSNKVVDTDGLVDSFKEFSMKNSDSRETMGTIEGNFDLVGDTSMSSAFNSSTFSFTPTTTTSDDHHPQKRNSLRQSLDIKTLSAGDRRKSSSLTMDPHGNSDATNLEALQEAVFDDSVIANAQKEAAKEMGIKQESLNPRPYDQMVGAGNNSSMGDSTLALLQSAFQSDNTNMDRGDTSSNVMDSSNNMSYKYQQHQAYLRQDPS